MKFLKILPTALPLFFSVALLNTGCSLSPEKAKSLTSYELCKTLASKVYSDNAKGNALNEVSQRGFDCSPVFRQVDAESAAAAKAIQSMQQNSLQQQQISNQNTQNLINSLNRNNQQLQNQQNRQSNCTTTFFGNTARTNCY